MSVIDYLLAAVVALSVFIGFFRGFMREAISLVTWALAVWVALRFSFVVEPWLGVLDNSPAVRLWVARGVLFVGVLVIGALINHLMGRLVRGTGLSGTDRMLGMLFGLGRGALVVGVMVLAAQFAGLDEDAWWEDSALVPYGERIAEGLVELADEAGALLDNGTDTIPAPPVEP